MIIELPYPISTNRMYRNFNGRMVLSAEGKAYKTTAGWLAKQAKIHLLDGDVEFTVILHPKLNKDGSASKTRLDLDNCLKCAQDSLNGIAWRDDSQIVKIYAEVGQPRKGGGLTVGIKQLNSIGAYLAYL